MNDYNYDEHKEWRDSLKPGDKVAVRTGYGFYNRETYYKYRTILRITPQRIAFDFTDGHRTERGYINCIVPISNETDQANQRKYMVDKISDLKYKLYRTEVDRLPITNTDEVNQACDTLLGLLEQREEKTMNKFEEICKAVHDSWWEEKKDQGVTDHPDMIPYEDLEESVKEYNRVTVRAVFKAIGIEPEELEEQAKAKQNPEHKEGKNKMEQLIENAGEYLVMDNCNVNGCDEKCIDCEHYYDVMEKLYQYEQSGLTPAEVAELAKAKEDGRLVVLPEIKDERDYINYCTFRDNLLDFFKEYSDFDESVGIFRPSDLEYEIMDIVTDGFQKSTNHFDKTTKEEAQQALERSKPE